MDCKRFYKVFLLLLVPAAAALRAQEIPRPESAQFTTLIHTASSDTAKASALIRYGNFLIDYHKDSAVAVLQQALLLEASTGRSFTLGKGHLLLGVAYAEKGDYLQAKKAYEQAIHYYTAGGHYTELVKAYNNLSNLYNIQGLMEEAVSGYLQALRLAEQKGVDLPLGMVFNNIAAGLQKLGHHQQSLYYCTRGEAIARQKRDSLALAQILLPKSAALLKIEQKGAAEACIREALNISNNIGYTVGKAVSLINLADFHFDNRRFDSSLYYQQRAKHWATLAADPYYQNAVFYGLGKTCFAINHYDEAVQNLIVAKELALQLRDKDHLAKILSTLSEVYAAQGRYAQSLAALRSSNRYADSLQNENVSRQVTQLETRYRIAEKDKALAQQQLRLVQQRAELKMKNAALLLTIGGLAAVCVIVVLGYRNYRQKQRLQAQRLLALQKEKETEALHAMMQGEEKERIRMARELHDGVGSELSAARMYLEHLHTHFPGMEGTAPYQEALTLVAGAAAEIRKTAHNLMPEVLHQQGLIEAVQTFCDKISRSNSLEVVFQSYGAPSRLKDSFELMVYRLVQELLHNTVRHAQASQAVVQLSFTDDLLSLTVEDNGIGFDLAAIDSRSGMGLSSLQARVAAFGGYMDIDTARGRGTATYIEFNLNERTETKCA